MQATDWLRSVSFPFDRSIESIGQVCRFQWECWSAHRINLAPWTLIRGSTALPSPARRLRITSVPNQRSDATWKLLTQKHARCGCGSQLCWRTVVLLTVETRVFYAIINLLRVELLR